MKRKFLMIPITLWTIIAIFVAGILISGINGSFDFSSRPVKEETASLNGIQTINLQSSYQRIEIIKTNSSSMKVTQYSNRKSKDANLFFISQKDGNINIYFKNEQFFNIFNFNINEKLVIEIPEEFMGNLEVTSSSGSINVDDSFKLMDVQLKNSSGGIRINKKLTADNLNVSASSGGIQISDIIIDGAAAIKNTSGSIKFNGTVAARTLTAETSSGTISSSMDLNVDDKITLASTSGSIKINETIRTEEFSAKTSSGGIRLGYINTSKYYLYSTSGRITSDSISGSGEAKTSSGGIQLSLTNPQGDVTLSSTSGSIKITLESSLEFTLEAETSSGSIRTNFSADKNSKGNKLSAAIGDNPTAHITAKASSGGIKVEN